MFRKEMEAQRTAFYEAYLRRMYQKYPQDEVEKKKQLNLHKCAWARYTTGASYGMDLDAEIDDVLK